jgi:putative ABC transport system permease protein
MTLAVEPDSLGEVFHEPEGNLVRSPAERAAYARLLSRRGNVLIDRTSRKEHGDARTWRPGAANRLNGRPVEVVGDVKIGTGFGYNGLLVLSEETMQDVSGWPASRATFGLVKLSPGRTRGAAGTSSTVGCRRTSKH